MHNFCCKVFDLHRHKKKIMAISFSNEYRFLIVNLNLQCPYNVTLTQVQGTEIIFFEVARVSYGF